MHLAPLALLSALTLSACVIVPLPNILPPAPPKPVPVAVAPDDACGASGLQSLVGQPSTVLQTMRFGVTTRVIEAGMAVTMDYSPNRLNIWLSLEKTIARVTCG